MLDETAKKANKLTLSQSVTKVRLDKFSFEKGGNLLVFSLLIYPVLFVQVRWKFEPLKTT